MLSAAAAATTYPKFASGAASLAISIRAGPITRGRLAKLTVRRLLEQAAPDGRERLLLPKMLPVAPISCVMRIL